MGTVFSFRIDAPGVARADLDRVLTWLHSADAMFSTYRADSEISRINAGSLSVSEDSPDVRRVLAECERYRVLMGGWFDARSDGRSLDPSGYVKGWAIQTASDMLRRAGSTNHCVNGGGDVQCVGSPQQGRGWRIGLSDPHRSGRVLRVVESVGPVGVATSGSAERGAHILDPHTAEPARTSVASASVVAADLVVADVVATAAVAMGAERVAEMSRSWPEVGIMLVDTDGSISTFGATELMDAS